MFDYFENIEKTRHVGPKNELHRLSDSIEEHFKLNLGNKENEILVIYLHGNTNDRAGGHRVSIHDSFLK